MPNPSFEMYDTCPYSYNQISFAHYWYSSTLGIAEYNNQCSLNGAGVPLNYWTYQYARIGVAYATIDFYETDNNNGLSIRDYVQTQLTDTLKSGRDYCVRFYVNLANSGTYLSPNFNLISIDKIGLYFSTNAIQSSNWYSLSVTPQILSSPGVFLSDTLNWMEISGTYTAHGGEKFITIGNFSTDANTDTMYLINNHSIHDKALYNIDDISIVECNVGIDEVKDEEMFEIFPNPITSTLTIQTNNNEPSEIILYDLSSRRLLQQTFTTTTTLNTEALAKGMYIYKVRNKKGISKTGKVIKE